MRRTRIIATIGPASVDTTTLTALIEAGVDVTRLNASHSDKKALADMLAQVRYCAERVGRPVAAMLDLPGPKLRVGDVCSGALLEKGAAFDIVAEDEQGDSKSASVPYDDLWRDVAAGDTVLLDDGCIVLEVQRSSPGLVETVVKAGGRLRPHKGVNVPSVRLSLPSVTAEDLELAVWAAEAGVDIVAQSFVRSAADVHLLREAMGPDGPWIVAKVEKHEAVDDLDAIIDAADAIMVARGDLGVEVPVEQVPILPRRIVATCRASGRPVIVATQMLESMIHAVSPTRAEASDVAQAIFQGADAVMLSAETAVGEDPVGVVETMARIALAAEAEGPPAPRRDRPRPGDVSEAVSAAVVRLAERLGAAAIITSTRSGSTACAVAAHRPSEPIVAVTSEPETARRLSLVWGVTALVIPGERTVEGTFDKACEAAVGAGLAHPGDIVALTAGVSVGRSGGTDLIRVITV